MYLTPTENHWACDIETDGLTPTVVWCMSVENLITGEKRTLTSYDEIRGFEQSNPTAIYVGHNFIKFDLPALNRIARTRIPVSRVVDTFVLSMLYSPSLAGGHSLDAWAERIGRKKVVHEDWSRLTPEMIHRCEEDTSITAEVYHRLTQRMVDVGFKEFGAWLEHTSWGLIEKQRKNGFALDFDKATALLDTLRTVEQQLKEKIHERFPPVLVSIGRYKSTFKADGSGTQSYLRHVVEYPKVALTDGGGHEVFDYVEFNIGSPPQRVQKLLELGWRPEEFTPPSKTYPKGQPKATDKGELSPSLARFADISGIDEVRLISQWIGVNGRANMVRNWLNLYNPETGCIHGNLWLANTLRYRHDNPNTTNIPAVRLDRDGQVLLGTEGYFTYEARDCWTTRDPRTRTLVGVDAKGIQLRVLANYLNNPEFTEAVLSGDPHTYNQRLAGLESRAKAKTFIYAFLLGAGDAKIGQIIGGSAKQGARVKQRFVGSFGGLPELLSRFKTELRRTGRITLCSGNRVLCSSDHMVLAYLLQGDESQIMKLAGVYTDQAVRKEKLDVIKVGDIHDEWQSDVLREHVPRYIELCRDAFKRAGDYYNYNLPIDCDAKEGLTWACTH